MRYYHILSYYSITVSNITSASNVGNVSSQSSWSWPIKFWKTIRLVEWNLRIFNSRVITCISTVTWSNRGPSWLQPVNARFEIEYHIYHTGKGKVRTLSTDPRFVFAYKYSLGHSWFLGPDSLSMCFVDQTLCRIKMAVCFKPQWHLLTWTCTQRFQGTDVRKRRGQTSQSYAARIATCRVVRNV